MNPRVLLTGGTGFLGQRVAARLIKAGYRLHVMARESSDRSVLAGMDVCWQSADIGDRESVDRAVATAHAEAHGAPLDLVHCAALISYRTCDRDLQWRVNDGGTRHVLDAARAHGVRRLLHTSSVVTVGHASGAETIDERAAFNGEELRVDYVDTKRAAELRVLAAADRLDVVVVNPSAIFGLAGAGSNSAYFLREVARGGVRLAPPGTVGVVGVEDTADGVLAALQQGRRGSRYLLSESSLPLCDLLSFVAHECGAAAPLATVPAGIWPWVARGAALIDGLKPLERLTPQSLRMVAVHYRVASDLARAELDWRPRPIREVLRETLLGLGLSRVHHARARD
ncbi:MAG: NAD-dependent epimerase/dehydratase family protein [bacterium]|nr:NAD-dependent epimerase/dehydratase family protein [Planctomycetota bacterium]HIL53025.1 NAD-dependent epimerase/dehydratase family protein [Planctomycetota bacterium]